MPIFSGPSHPMKTLLFIFLFCLPSFITAHGSPDGRSFNGVPMNITISQTKRSELSQTDKVGFNYKVIGEDFISPSLSGYLSFSKVTDIAAPSTYRQGDPAHSIWDLVVIYAVAEDTGNVKLLFKHLTPAAAQEVKKADSSGAEPAEVKKEHSLTVKLLLMVKQNSDIICFYSAKFDSEEDVSGVKISNSPQGYLVDLLDLDDPSNVVVNNIYNKLSDLVIAGDRDAIMITKN
jgi:hypothetical protein